MPTQYGAKQQGNHAAVGAVESIKQPEVKATGQAITALMMAEMAGLPRFPD